jgi:subfamily B ATP-binding cassette protein MsbA
VSTPEARPAPPSSHRPQESGERHPPARLFKALRRILGLTRPYRSRLYAALLLTALGSLVWLAVPLGLRSLLDAVFEANNRTLLNLLTLGLVTLFLVQGGLGLLGSYLLGWTGTRVVTDLRMRLYDHLHRQTFRFFANQRTGDLTSRLTNDVSSVREAVTSAIMELLTQSLSMIGSVGLMVVLNWRLSLLVFAVVPVVTLLARYFGQKTRKLARQYQDELADSTAVAEETLQAIRVVKAFAREPYEVARYNTAAEDLFKTGRHLVWIRALFGSTSGILFMGSLVGIFWYGGNEVLAERLSAGDLVAFLFYAMNIARSVGGMTHLYTTFNSAVGASERLFELLDSVPDLQDAPDARPLPPIDGTVAFDRLSFRYEANVPVLQDLTFTAQPGQTIALVGPSGAGKTTLLNLIPRFYDPTEGAARIDGHDLRTVTLRSLREQIAVVPQEPHLFNTSLRENIRYGRLEASDAEVEAAARAANADEFITALPEGYDAIVGERGVKLSGGQRQRIAIARALLRDARLLLLDEATSSLDSTSEAFVQEALERLMQGRTTFVIAHRLSTVQHADVILVLDQGRIVQQGTHEQLFVQEGLYRTLALRQFRESDVAEIPEEQ